ncbi:hypothetical protein H6503_06445 [Candidatus Woesearchaeota archaeon]|nr:hypothetical protein [Candidatus Woesearchaeota archaeon]
MNEESEEIIEEEEEETYEGAISYQLFPRIEESSEGTRVHIQAYDGILGRRIIMYKTALGIRIPFTGKTLYRENLPLGIDFRLMQRVLESYLQDHGMHMNETRIDTSKNVLEGILVKR